MGVPKQKHTKSRRNKRRMHIFLKVPLLTNCSKCGKTKLAHTVCSNCGFYKGREVIDVFRKLDKKERKRREKEIKKREVEEKKEKPLTIEDLSRR